MVTAQDRRELRRGTCGAGRGGKRGLTPSGRTSWPCGWGIRGAPSRCSGHCTAAARGPSPASPSGRPGAAGSAPGCSPGSGRPTSSSLGAAGTTAAWAAAQRGEPPHAPPQHPPWQVSLGTEGQEAGLHQNTPKNLEKPQRRGALEGGRGLTEPVLAAVWAGSDWHVWQFLNKQTENVVVSRDGHWGSGREGQCFLLFTVYPSVLLEFLFYFCYMQILSFQFKKCQY